MDTGETSSYRWGYVPGATPSKWARIWQERHGDGLALVQVRSADAMAALASGEVDAALLRLPVDAGLVHAIALYEEETVVLASRDHVLAATDPDEVIALAELADDVLLRPEDDVLHWRGDHGAEPTSPEVPGHPARARPATTAEAVELVAAGVGLLVAPRSLARLHHRKDVIARALAEAPASTVALAWRRDAEDERTEDLIGIVRGRTVNSSRGSSKEPALGPAAGTGDRRSRPSPRAPARRGRTRGSRKRR